MHTFCRALMDLTVVDGEVLCKDGQPFDRVAYSRFKYGLLPPASRYGAGLAALIVEELFELAGDDPIIIVSAPYKYLPTASHAIAHSLLQELSHCAVLDGREPPVLLPLHKARTGDASYAKSSQADRLKTVANLGLHIDESCVPGSHVLVVDDIRITGAAQQATAGYLEPLMPASIWYLHAARLPQDIGTAHPGLEDQLNQTVNHTLVHFLHQVAAGQFQLNTRVLRFILETQDTGYLCSFLEAAPLSLLEEIHQAGVGSGSEYYQRHRRSLEVVYDILQRRRSGDSRSFVSAAVAD